MKSGKHAKKGTNAHNGSPAAAWEFHVKLGSRL